VATKRLREVGRLPVADQARYITYRDRPLLDQQLSGRGHPSREQILMEAGLAELRIRALQLARRAGQGASHNSERERPPVVPRNHHAREQVQPAARAECV